MRKKRKILIIVGLMTGVLLVAWQWPISSYDFTNVHPIIQNLKQPYQNVYVSYYLDGGSIGIRIIDQDGQQLKLALPISEGPEYRKLYQGATHHTETNAVEIVFSEDTRKYLIDTIEHYAESIDRDISLIALRGAFRDYAKAYGHALLRRENGP